MVIMENNLWKDDMGGGCKADYINATWCASYAKEKFEQSNGSLVSACDAGCSKCAGFCGPSNDNELTQGVTEYQNVETSPLSSKQNYIVETLTRQNYILKQGLINLSENVQSVIDIYENAQGSIDFSENVQTARESIKHLQGLIDLSENVQGSIVLSEDVQTAREGLINLSENLRDIINLSEDVGYEGAWQQQMSPSQHSEYLRDIINLSEDVPDGGAYQHCNYNNFRSKYENMTCDSYQPGMFNHGWCTDEHKFTNGWIDPNCKSLYACNMDESKCTN